MEIRRFFVKPANFDGMNVVIDGEEFNHAVKVLRQKVGYTIVFNTGDGFDYYAEIIAIEKKSLSAKLIKKEANAAVPEKRIILCQGSLKGGKNDFVVQKAVELGISEIIFFVSSFVTETNINISRLEKIAVEAMKQCGRADTVSVKTAAFEDAVQWAQGSRIVFYEGEGGRPLVDAALGETATIFVGSEGGFDKKEIDLLKNEGFFVATLGKRILRAETAAVVCTALVAEKMGCLK